MPVPAYLTITGSVQGDISNGALTPESVGTLSQASFENQILIHEFHHNVSIPRDLHTGQAAGQRVHNPIKMVKSFDKSSPLLYTALVNGEQLKCKLQWYRIASSGALENYFTTEFESAIILDINSNMPNCQDPNLKHFGHLEEICLSYKKITWTHNTAGTSGSDDWNSPIMS